MCNFSPSTVYKSYPKRKRKKYDFLMANHPSKNNKKVAIKPPKTIEVYRQHYDSMSIMTSEVNTKKKKVVLKPRKSDKNKDNECSYKNCLYKNLKLVDCATKRCKNKLHHLCQNNIDQSSYDGSFESHFGNIFCCSKCIENKMKLIPPYNHKLFDSETSEDEVVDEEAVQFIDQDIDVDDEVVQSNNEVDEEVVHYNDVVEEDEDQSNNVVDDNVNEVNDDQSNEADVDLSNEKDEDQSNEEDEDQSNVVVDDNLIEMNDDDSDCSDDDSECSDEEYKGTSDSDKDNEGDEAVEDKNDKEYDNEINEDESVINDITL